VLSGRPAGDAGAAARSSRWGDSPEHGGSASTAAGFDTDEEQEGGGGAARKRAGAGVGAAAAAASSTGGRRNRWDETPALASGGGFGAGDEDEGATPAAPAAAWETPHHPSAAGAAGAGLPRAKRSRWDETPAVAPGGLAAAGATPALLSGASATPMLLGAGGVGATPTPGHLAAGAATPALGAYGPGATPGGVGELARSRAESEMDARNRPLGDDELDAMFPPGYKVLEPPATYVPIRTPSRKLMATPTPMGAGAGGATGFRITDTPSRDAYGVPLGPGDMPSADGEGGGVPGGDLPAIRPEELQYFGKLLERDVVEEELSLEEQKERQIMRLLLKIKGGTPPQRKAALRQIADKARYFGAGPLFNQLLPLMISPSLEDLERHLLVKVIDRVLFRLDELVRPYVHKILAVIEPMLIDEDYYARVEGREIIANLAKAAGLATMISTMRPDIDHAEEYVRNITSRAFAVVGSALGIPAMLPFLKAVAASKKSWQARHTGVKIVQQIAILMGVSVLPHLRLLVGIVAPSLKDDQAKVRMMGALAIGALAEASHPYGFEAFDEVLRPLWEGIRQQRGKNLAAFLKAIGCLIPLMEAEYAGWYTREIMPVVVREFASPEEEMRRIVLKVVKQCAGTAGVTPEYVRTSVLPDFFKHFWVRRMAYDRRSYRAVVDTTLSLAEKVGAADIISQVVEDLKDDAEPYRRMVVETVDKVVAALGASDINPRLEEQLMDGLLYAFQEQAAVGAEEGSGGGGLSGSGARVILNGFGTVVAALGGRCKPYLPQIAGTIKWRLNNKSPQVRMEAADLVGRVAGVMKLCGEDGLLGHLGVVLYECLGEEYPEVLGSILGGLKSIVNVIGMVSMQPPVKDLLPRLTPILKNRQERVQENCIDLVGRIADRGAEHVSPKEWMRICFDLLEMLRAPKKAIRRACVNTFGYIAKAIGPQDVLHALLNNLKVQERTMRVCTTIAIAIVAETCQPYTVLPALLNEYRIPDLNVQNGVLKALSFMFEYIGELSRDYVYAVVPLLEDALMERDPVHRQTAMFAVKHLALGLQGLGCEDALQHLLNYIWPNVFETLPHVILSFFESVEAMRVSLGPHVIMQYLLQGLFHPARKVREPYWKVYNNLYVYAADALTPLYPALPDEGYNRYTRTYLELVV
jgi:splicing factor 3B subunit 1